MRHNSSDFLSELVQLRKREKRMNVPADESYNFFKGLLSLSHLQLHFYLLLLLFE